MSKLIRTIKTPNEYKRTRVAAKETNKQTNKQTNKHTQRIRDWQVFKQKKNILTNTQTGRLTNGHKQTER